MTEAKVDKASLRYGGEMIDRGVTITLSPDQAVVLSDWLDRVIGTERFDSFIHEDPAVWSPLYQLAGTLETTLPEIFAADYNIRLDAARRRLLPTLGSSAMHLRAGPSRSGRWDMRPYHRPTAVAPSTAWHGR